MEPFSLDTDDRTDEERTKTKATKKDRQAYGKAKAPMDTELAEDHGDFACQVRINLNFSGDIQGIKAEPDQHERFDIKRLFDAVSSGDVTRLESLEEYLLKTHKKLTNNEYRPNGKTALMKALLNLKNGDNKAVEHLLGIADRMGHLDKLVNAAYTDPYYEGQTALHIAIERRNKRYVELLIQKGADVHAKACGTFFQPLGEACFYFGELPLSLAACTNQKDIVDLLMDKADVRRTDTLGNTVLHALVMVADNSPENTDFVISMYDYILTKDAAKNPKEKKLEDIENNQGLTSIKLAAKLGRIGLFEHILHREFPQEECRHLSRKFTEWAYGPVYASLYDLDSVDSYEPNSVLEIVVYGTEIPNRLEMLQTEPLNKLLEDKWNRYAHRIFLFKFIVYIIYLIIFTTVSYYREEGTSEKRPPFPIKKYTQKNVEANIPDGYLLFVGQVIMAIGSLYFFISVLMNIKRKRPSLKTLLVDGYSELLFLLQAVFFIICAGLYCGGMNEYLAFLVLSVALCWVNVLYFSRGTRHMGIYSVMIQKMILSDILRFLFVYVVFLFGFSAAVVTLLKDDPEELNGPAQNNRTHGRSFFTDNPNPAEGCNKPTFKTIAFTTLELFKFTIGMGDLEFTEKYEYKHVFYVLLITYIVLTYILLLNMLIALMSKTVEKMSKESTGIWKLQRAITILDLERYACCLKNKLRSGVRRNLGKRQDDWRWCLRVEEVNWKKWNRNLGIISEDPGECNTVMQTGPQREPSRRGFLREISRRRPHTRMVPSRQETEPLASSPV
ncbi:transient receptor potential cation channel subfamily V member 1 [Ictalurus furcatus]|uniref:transient receptor potential cation channel subfamily V member 1 n=1 Tax=Ictalurus furcatus TaxID=66913 RepID=UPI00234FD02C|nr:transient receptor potential cation channel subfamily V member 1 [Ictalurus furcatus]